MPLTCQRVLFPTYKMMFEREKKKWAQQKRLFSVLFLGFLQCILSFALNFWEEASGQDGG